MKKLPRLNPALVNGSKDSAEKEEKVKKEKKVKPKKADNKNNDKKVKKPKSEKVSKKEEKTVVKSGKIPSFKDFVAKPAKKGKVDFADTATVANHILLAATKTFNSNNNASKIAKAAVNTLGPDLKKVASSVLDVKFGDAVVAQNLAKVVKKVDGVVSGAVKAAAKGKLDKTGLAVAVTAAQEAAGGTKVAKKAKSTKDKADKPAKKKKKK